MAKRKGGDDDDRVYVSESAVMKIWDSGAIQATSKEFARSIIPVLISAAVNFTVRWIVDKNTNFENTIDVTPS